MIFYQDLRHRAVWWFLFPSLFLVNVSYFLETLNWLDVAISLLFIVFLMISLTLYLSLKMKKLVLVWNGFFSWGDLLFIVAITPLFTWINFIYFFTFGTVLVLLIHLIASKFLKDQTVPYAGYLSLATIFYILFTLPINQLFAQLSGN